jgi:ABC-type transport system involved in multi-copper enzyme maturation permease subunit
MNKIFLIAGKEYKDAMKNKLFLVVFLLLVVLTVTSIIVASLLFQSKVLDYQNSVQALKESGKIVTFSEPQFYPLKLLRGFVDYLEIIGAVLGIVLGYYSIAKEKNRRTLQLILTRPVRRADIISGKLLGNTLLISTTVILIGIISWLSLIFVGHATLSGLENTKFLIVILLSIIYIIMFFSLSSFLSLRMKTLSNALIICFVIWLVFVLIIPQIGDTMDPDNQVPGGLFNSLGLDKPHEIQVLSHFSSYETNRDHLEQSSITKHYERATFAFLGIKDEFNDMPLSYIFAQKWIDLLVVFFFTILCIVGNYYIVYRKDTLSKGE